MSDLKLPRFEVSRSNRHIITSLCVLILFVLGVTVFLYQRTKLRTIDGEVKTGIAQIKEAYGVDIHYRYDPKVFFPEEDLLPPVSAKGSQISSRHGKSLLAIIEQFLSTYPNGVVKNNLSAIYLVGKLEFYGKSYGGTYTRSAIYIRTKGKFLRYSASTVLGLMHAEFSNILFHNYNFPKEEWEALNQPGWKYEGSGFEMLGRPDLYDQTEGLFHSGFLEKYSQSSLENDFKMFVDWAFTRPNRLRELVSRYDRIKKKYDLVIQFYKSIDPRIDIPRIVPDTERVDGTR
jgi:hypothetical protein